MKFDILGSIVEEQLVILTPITQDRVKELLRYDPNTGVFTWRQTNKMHNIGAIAGSVAKSGYRYISIDHSPILAHRIAWFMWYGYWPEQVIDHKNRKKDDNRIRNLRDTSYSENRWNSAPCDPKGQHP